MITPRHGRDGFFKYYTAESAKLTLKNTSRKWSTPLLFNDPFDSRFDLYFEEPSDELAAENLAQFHAIITSPEPLKPNQFGTLTPVIEMIQQVHLQHPDFRYTEDEMAYLQDGVVTTLRDKTQSYEVLPYAPEEVGAVYLGCAIAKDNKNEIIAITRGKYADAKVYQAEKHDREFALVFREIM